MQIKEETSYLFVHSEPMEVHCRSHLGQHPENRLHVPSRNHYQNDHYHALDLCRALRHGEGMAFRSEMEGEGVVLAGLVWFLANLLEELGSSRYYWDHSYRHVLGMFELV